MSDERRVNPRFEEDLVFERSSGPARYASKTDKPVRYFAVANDSGAVLGYVWANDEDDAAGWVTRPAGGDEAYNGGYMWLMKLRDAKARGIAPTRALAELLQGSEDIVTTHVVPGSEAEAPSQAVLKQLAAQA
ncbi:hypothetical protein ACFY2W_23010 [Streptomyces sp. NPDC001262]|uniref:hypothetical protein n=1 Tax=Streptomyces sp. NPDC001262 TaxID=3364552 RepID=UPI00369A199C